MKDVMKQCARCRHSHAWGILRHDQAGTPLYGARSCTEMVDEIRCQCLGFIPQDEHTDNLPALNDTDIKELWSATSFLNAQVPMATRIMVKQIIESGREVGMFGKLFGSSGKSVMERQWPEFMGLMISQLTDLRGAMFRDENKFAHLVAHTDEIIESMKGVVQLKERLDNIYAIQERMLEAVQTLTEKVSAPENPNPYQSIPKGVTLAEAAHTFAAKSAPLWNEAIPADSEPNDD